MSRRSQRNKTLSTTTPTATSEELYVPHKNRNLKRTRVEAFSPDAFSPDAFSPASSSMTFYEEKEEEVELFDVFNHYMFADYTKPPMKYCRKIAKLKSGLSASQIERIDNSMYYYIGKEEYGGIMCDAELMSKVDETMSNMEVMGLSLKIEISS